MILAALSKSLLAALAAIATWGAAAAWDHSSSAHSSCPESNPDRASYAHEAEIGLGIALLTPKRWKGPAVTLWFGSAALVHAHAADQNQNWIRAGLACR